MDRNTVLIGPPGSLAGKRVLEAGCGRGVAVEYGILHHVSNWQKALEKIARVLKPGGTFYFEDILKGFVSVWLIRVLFDHPQKTQFYGWEFRAGLETPGLQVKKWRQWGEWGVMGQAEKY